MPAATHIKKTIDFNRGFRALLEVLKLVAVSEYHALERKLKTFEELQEVFAEFFSCIDVEGIDHPFTNPRGKPPAVVAVTSDAGLLGGINNQVVTRAIEMVRETGGGPLVIVGERGTPYAQDANVPYKFFPGVVDARRFEQACDLRDALVEMLISGKAGGLRIVYPRAHSFVVHRVEVVTLLPFKQPVAADAPVKTIPAPAGKDDEFIFESEAAKVAEYLIFILIAQRIYEIFGLSRVCEQAARYLHLEESCNKILEMNKKLLLVYFKRRHEVIDANMRELFSARIGVHDDE